MATGAATPEGTAKTKEEKGDPARRSAAIGRLQMDGWRDRPAPPPWSPVVSLGRRGLGFFQGDHSK